MVFWRRSFLPGVFWSQALATVEQCLSHCPFLFLSSSHRNTTASNWSNSINFIKLSSNHHRTFHQRNIQTFHTLQESTLELSSPSWRVPSIVAPPPWELSSASSNRTSISLALYEMNIKTIVRILPLILFSASLIRPMINLWLAAKLVISIARGFTKIGLRVTILTWVFLFSPYLSFIIANMSQLSTDILLTLDLTGNNREMDLVRRFRNDRRDWSIISTQRRYWRGDPSFTSAFERTTSKAKDPIFTITRINQRFYHNYQTLSRLDPYTMPTVPHKRYMSVRSLSDTIVEAWSRAMIILVFEAPTQELDSGTPVKVAPTTRRKNQTLRLEFEEVTGLLVTLNGTVCKRLLSHQFHNPSEAALWEVSCIRYSLNNSWH